MGRVSWQADGFFLRVVWVGSTASGRAAGAGRPDASSTVFRKRVHFLSLLLFYSSAVDCGC